MQILAQMDLFATVLCIEMKCDIVKRIITTRMLK